MNGSESLVLVVNVHPRAHSSVAVEVRILGLFKLCVLDLDHLVNVSTLKSSTLKLYNLLCDFDLASDLYNWR